MIIICILIAIIVVGLVYFQYMISKILNELGDLRAKALILHDGRNAIGNGAS